MNHRSLRGALLALCLIAPIRAEDRISVARIFSDASALEAPRGIEAHAVHLARAEYELARQALDDDALGRWLDARLDLQSGNAAEAHRKLSDLASAWADDPSFSARLLRQLDRDRADAAFAAQDLDGLSKVLGGALGEHGEDGLWLAQKARAEWARGEDARTTFERARELASSSDQRRPVFLWHALAALAAGDPESAATIWLEQVESLRWPQELRAAIDLFDQHPEIATALDQDGQRERAIGFYARILRRSDAHALAVAAQAGDDAEERARCFVLGAEQLYRLREHAALASWLQQSWPEELDDEGRASLLAYPWGVKRRSGASIEIAEGFDRIWRDFPETRRGLEALWESAWMYELSDQPLEAEIRFLEYARHDPTGPLASAAAVRAIGLPAQRGEYELVLERFRELAGELRNTNDAATADWLVWNAAERLATQLPAAGEIADLLRHSPFRQPVPHPWDAAPTQRPSIDAILQELLRLQTLSFQRVAERLDVDLRKPDDPDYLEAEELYRLGLALEGDYVLNRWSAERRSEPAVQLQATWLAWRMGRPERQARSGYLLRQQLEDDASPALQTALDRIAHPTPFARDLLDAAREQSLPAGLLWGVMRRESFYDPAVVSLAGAYGLLQLLPSTAAQMAALLEDPEPDLDGLRQPLLNLRYGSRYLRQLLDESSGDLYRTLAAYNAGEANGERWAQRRGPEGTPESMLFWISYSETRAYVYHALRFWRLYGDIYPSLGSFDGLTQS